MGVEWVIPLLILRTEGPEGGPWVSDVRLSETKGSFRQVGLNRVLPLSPRLEMDRCSNRRLKRSTIKIGTLPLSTLLTGGGRWCSSR